MADSPGETNVPIGSWTIGSLKIYFDTVIGYERQIVDERDKRYHERWQAQEKASERYQEVSNEFRGSLDDLSTKMATKTELETAITTLIDKIDTQGKDIANLRSRLDVGNPDVATLQNKEANRTGRTMGADKTIAYIISAIGILFGLVGWLS